ncbi:MAG TPA: endonuclease/exonuclease/phosphatase family protein, partial [Solirubrobacteraceae bacterium]
MSTCVLTWNLFHGRSVPAAGRSLRLEFASMLAGWRWDVALLQEVPPWWTADLAAACAARGAAVLTSRNSALPLRHALAERWPDAIKSNGGGANVILLRDTSERLRSSHVRLRVWPERRVAQAVWLPDGSVAVNYHGSARVPLA